MFYVIRLVRAAKKEPATINGKAVRFTADYSNHTVKHRRDFSQAMDTGELNSFCFTQQLWKSKMDFHVFNNPKEADDFLHSTTIDDPPGRYNVGATNIMK